MLCIACHHFLKWVCSSFLSQVTSCMYIYSVIKFHLYLPSNASISTYTGDRIFILLWDSPSWSSGKRYSHTSACNKVTFGPYIFIAYWFSSAWTTSFKGHFSQWVQNCDSNHTNWIVNFKQRSASSVWKTSEPVDVITLPLGLVYTSEKSCIVSLVAIVIISVSRSCGDIRCESYVW